MSILRVDGFDAYQTPGAALTGASLAGTGYSLFSNGGTDPIKAAAGVTAESLAFEFTRSGSFYSNMAYSFDSTADTLVIGFAFKGGTRGSLFRLNGALTIEWPGTGPLALNGTEGPNTIVLGRWYYLELVIDKVAGSATLYVNDTNYLSVALPGALGTATSWSAAFGWQSTGASGALSFDDLLILDGIDSGDGIVSRLGPVENRTLTAETAPVMEFDNPTVLTPVQVANSVPPQESVYLESQTSGDRVLFNRSDYAEARPILALTLAGVLSKTDIDERQMGLQIDDGTGVMEEVFMVGLTFAYKQVTYAADSQGTPWTPATINASQWGAVVRP